MRALFMLFVICAGSFALADPIPSSAPNPADERVISSLIDALKDADPDVRQNLGVALAKFGAAAVEPLQKALTSDTSARRAGAAYALGQLGPTAKPALPKLLDLLTDNELDVRRQASFAVGRILPNRPSNPGKK
jgi:HEAT repeat protein